MRSVDEHPLERAAAMAALALLAFALLLELSAGIAGVVSGRGWVGLPLGEVADALPRLPAHAADPRAAFVPESRDRLPSAPLWYATLLGVLTALAAVGVRLVGWARRGS